MNVRTQFYMDITDRLGKSLPAIKHFDLWNEQASHMNEEEAFGMPACFLKFHPVEWRTLGRKRQQADLLFDIVLMSETGWRTSRKGGAASKALEHLEMIDRIHRYLEGYSESYFNSITRTGSQHDHDHDALWVHFETYRTLITDDSAVRNYIKAKPSFKPDVNII